MSVCKVRSCKNKYDSQKSEGKPLSFFQFPKDEFYKEKWRQATGLGILTAKSARICSIHFSKECFEEDWIKKTYNLPPHRERLKKDAIPTLHLEEEIETFPPEVWDNNREESVLSTIEIRNSDQKSVPVELQKTTKKMSYACAVPGCFDRNSPRHRFPNPDTDTERFDKWIKLIGNKKLIAIDPIKVFRNYRVCHLHFATSLRTTNILLNQTILPSVNLPVPLRDFPEVISIPSKSTEHSDEESECDNDRDDYSDCRSDEDKVIQKVGSTKVDPTNGETRHVRYEIEQTESPKICRLCMKKVNDIKNIFEDCLEDKTPIHLAITLCLYPLEVSADDSLSKYGCNQCLEKLSNFVKFKKLVLGNDKFQRKCFNQPGLLISTEGSLGQKRNVINENESYVVKKIKIERRTKLKPSQRVTGIVQHDHQPSAINPKLENAQLTGEYVESDQQLDSPMEIFEDFQPIYATVLFLLVNGYLMEQKVLTGSLRYLKCSQKNCATTGTQEILMPGKFSNRIVISKPHNHSKPTEMEIKKQKFICVIRKILQNMRGSNIRSVYEELCKLDPYVAQLVPLENLAHEICDL